MPSRSTRRTSWRGQADERGGRGERERRPWPATACRARSPPACLTGAARVAAGRGRRRGAPAGCGIARSRRGHRAEARRRWPSARAPGRRRRWRRRRRAAGRRSRRPTPPRRRRAGRRRGAARCGPCRPGGRRRRWAARPTTSARSVRWVSARWTRASVSGLRLVRALLVVARQRGPVDRVRRRLDDRQLVAVEQHLRVAGAALGPRPAARGAACRRRPTGGPSAPESSGSLPCEAGRVDQPVGERDPRASRRRPAGRRARRARPARAAWAAASARPAGRRGRSRRRAGQDGHDRGAQGEQAAG